MSGITDARDRLERAGGPPDVLSAACDAFEAMLAVCRQHDDPSDPVFNRWLIAGTQAANGRDAVLFAPSLPPVPANTQATFLEDATAGESAAFETAGETADTVAALSSMLAVRMLEVSRSSADPGDRARCQDAAGCAREIRDLLAGGGR